MLMVAILSLCVPSVVAVSVGKHSTDVHSGYAIDMKGKQQTYLAAWLGGGDTSVTMGVGQYVYLKGVLSSTANFSQGIPNETINTQQLNSDGKTWATVYTETTMPDTSNIGTQLMGTFIEKLTPQAAGVYTYRMTFNGDDQHEPAVSNTVTLTVTNVVIS